MVNSCLAYQVVSKQTHSFPTRRSSDLKLISFPIVIIREFKQLLNLYFLRHSNKYRLEKQDVFESNDLFKLVTAMTTGVNRLITAKIKT